MKNSDERSVSISAWLTRSVSGDTALIFDDPAIHRGVVSDERLDRYEFVDPASASGERYDSLITVVDGSHCPSLKDVLLNATAFAKVDGAMFVVVVNGSAEHGLRPSDVISLAPSGTYLAALELGEDWFGVVLEQQFDPEAYIRVVRDSEARLDSTTARLHGQEALAQDRQRRINELLDEFEAALGDVDELNDETTILEQRALEAASELKRAKDGLDAAQDKVRSLKSELDSAVKDHARRETEWSKTRESLDREREGLDRKIASLQQTLTHAQEREKSLSKRVENLQGTIDELKSRNDRRRARIQRLERDRGILRHRLQIERWKLARMRSRRWWRLGHALRDLVKRPWRVAHNLRALAGLTKPTPSVPRPQPVHDATTSDTSGPDRQSSVTAGADQRESPPSAAGQRGAGFAALVDLEPSTQKDEPDDFRARTRAPLMPFLAPPRPTAREVRMAAILDEMSAASYGPECELITFTPNTWKETLESLPPHLLLVESAWRGNGGSWEYRVGSYSYPESEGLPDLRALVDWCRERDIPTVFWNKEDPVHFEKFKEAAALFDIIVTTDADRVPHYEELPESRASVVDVLAFAAQPQIHHPIGPWPRATTPAFGGTFYRNRHPERQQQLEALLDAAVPFGLVIFDRMGGEVTESFGFPERFRPYIVGGLPYGEMVDAYRRHRVFLNANSVTSSPTMFSRRVFELLACGTPVVSTPSTGLAEIFGGVVHVAEDTESASAAIQELIDDEGYWARVSAAGALAVARDHLYRDRLMTLLDLAGITSRITRPTVEILEEDEQGEVVLRRDIASWTPNGEGRTTVAGIVRHRAAAARLVETSEAQWIAVGPRANNADEVEALTALSRLVDTEMVVAGEPPNFRFIDGRLPDDGSLIVRREALIRSLSTLGGDEAPSALGLRVLSAPLP